jgi:hypothetical protein
MVRASILGGGRFHQRPPKSNAWHKCNSADDAGVDGYVFQHISTRPKINSLGKRTKGKKH